MAQICYLGIDSDFTQEIGLLATRVASRARIVEGLGASVQDGSSGQVNLVFQPGIFIMPDGMVVKETEIVKLPLNNLDSNQVGYTVFAKRYGQDTVYYDIILGLHYQDTLKNALSDSDLSLTVMPLAFVFKLASIPVNPTNSQAALYKVRNLGTRGQITYTHFLSPISGLIQDKLPINNVVLKDISDSYGMYSELQPSLIGNTVQSYFQFNAPDNQFLKGATLVGQRLRLLGNAAANIKFYLVVTSQSLSNSPDYYNNAQQTLIYEDPDLPDGSRPLIYQTFVYPTGSKITRDLLTIEVVNEVVGSSDRVNTTPFELNEIILSTLGIFG